ncbi:hypothetical protein NDU88_003933 [Pleurodeles waltl]|uniref:Uncharacterized protein n=1 Tax=Pleurodeles waltl TaxID=8319 RepID=A0AAV7VGS2_PLEWA|nr:hypothetical protein NDU88_003933 [Pleurodeles waltl]
MSNLIPPCSLSPVGSQNGGRDGRLIRALRSRLARNILKGAPPWPGCVDRDGGSSRGDWAARLEPQAPLGAWAKRGCDSRVRAGCDAEREELRLRPRSCPCLARPPPASGPARGRGAEETRPGADRTADLAGRPGAREDSVGQRGRDAILNLTTAVAACTSCSGTKKGHSSPAKKTLSSGGPAGCGGFRCRV